MTGPNPNAPVVVNRADGNLHAGCSLCDSQTGPFTYAGTEDHRGAVHLCARCVRLHAKAHGLVKGRREEQLLHADAMLREKDDENRELGERNQQLTDSNALLIQENTELKETQDVQRQRIAQLEDTIVQDAHARLAVVGK